MMRSNTSAVIANAVATVALAMIYKAGFGGGNSLSGSIISGVWVVCEEELFIFISIISGVWVVCEEELFIFPENVLI